VLLRLEVQKGCQHGRARPYFRPMRQGFSLPELVLVFALGGILFAIAVPPLVDAVDRIEVGAAASHIAAAHQRARIMAITRSQVVVLSIDSAELSIRPRGTPMSLWSEPGPAASGISLAGPARQFTFSPEGFTLGLSNATLHLSRGAATRTVVVSRLGRVRVVR
jgi:prepilin-type N-terminal cleavage/methylation domain-containing protein